MVTEAWLPLSIRRDASAAVLRKPLYQILLGNGLAFGGVVQETLPTLVDPAIATHLAVPVGTPALRLIRLIQDADDRPVLHLTVHASAERSRILMEVPASAANTLPAGHLLHELLPSTQGDTQVAALRPRRRKPMQAQSRPTITGRHQSMTVVRTGDARRYSFEAPGMSVWPYQLSLPGSPLKGPARSGVTQPP